MNTPTSPEPILLSVVTPVYAGQSYLPDLVSAISETRDTLRASGSLWQIHEAIFVCDDPIDDSVEVLYEIQKDPANNWVRVVHLAQNYGQHPATIAGILHASGDWIATIDEDLQHDPKFIGNLLRHAVNDGLDVVYGKPEEAVHESSYRDLGSRYFKRFIAFFSDNPNVVHYNSFRLMRGGVARAAASIATHDTYYDIALSWYTNKVGYLVLPLKDERYIRTGKSGYSFRRLVSHARRMFSNSQVKVLRLGAAVGALAIIFATVFSALLLILWTIDHDVFGVRGWLSTFLTILFFGGLNALLIGFALEHLSIILLKAQGKPSFFVIDRSSDPLLRESFEQQSGEQP